MQSYCKRKLNLLIPVLVQVPTVPYTSKLQSTVCGSIESLMKLPCFMRAESGLFTISLVRNIYSGFVCNLHTIICLNTGTIMAI